MKRWPLVASFVLFIALCATLAYWAMQFFKPPVRPVAAPPPSAQAPVNIDAAASLFGGRGSAAVASNFQLKGVILSGTPADSVVIIAADGKPAQAIRVNSEIAPGVKVKEVNRGFVILLDNGVEKRVELPEDSKLVAGMESARAAPVATAPLPARPAPAMPATVVDDADNTDNSNNAEPAASSPSTSGPASSTSVDDTAPPPAPARPSTGAAANAGTSSATASRAAVPAAPAPPSTPSPASNAGMGSPPITNQGSLAGSANSPAPAAPAVPGMPVTPQPPRR
jgi:general secretion pathway protein C